MHGWGEVIYHNDFGDFELDVSFILEDGGDLGLYESFTYDGKVVHDDNFPLLSLTEYSLETGGFTPISKYWDSIIDKWGYFWDYTHHNTAIFEQLKDIKYHAR